MMDEWINGTRSCGQTKPEQVTPRGQVLSKAYEHVIHERNIEYGDPVASMESVAVLWRAYLSMGDPAELDGEDVATMMELLKIARCEAADISMDSYEDRAGYAAVAAECRASKGGE